MVKALSPLRGACSVKLLVRRVVSLLSMLHRRQFLQTTLATAAVSALRAQTPPPAPDWGGPVIDIHLHLRRGLEANMIHMQGCGVSNANLLSRDNSAEQVHQIQAKYPGHFVWSAGTNAANPEAADLLKKAVKDGGAIGLGELKSHVEADGPEMRKLYALAAELNVPILVHFQEVDHLPGEGKWNSGFKRFDAILKSNPKTTFVGHADAFWANISADYAEQAAYPADRSNAAESPIAGSRIIPICSAIFRPTRVTTL